jgi:hypothetical protein
VSKGSATGNIAYIERKIVGLSPNHCCRRHARVRCVRIVELQTTVDDIRILSVAHQCFCGEFISPASIKFTQVFT